MTKADDELDAALQRGLVGGDPPGLGGETTRVARCADVAGELVALAGDAEAARAQVVPGTFDDRVGLPGEQRLVGLHAAAVEQRPVDDDPVTGPHPEHVAAYDRVRRHLDVPAVADDEHLCPVEQLQAVELALGRDLLGRADHRVDQAEPDADERVVVAPSASSVAPMTNRIVL
jgi:hypothetical protein